MDARELIERKREFHKNKVKYQLSIQRTSLSREGLLNLSDLRIDSLKDLGTQKYLKTLNISETDIASLESLPPQPNLQQIVCDNTDIDSFVGLSRHPKLKSVSFLHTPLSERENFRLSCLVIVGQMLSVINGVPVTQRERIQAAEYPVISRYLLEAGWDIQVPVPSIDDFRELAMDFRLKLKGCDLEFTNDESQKYLIPPPQLVPINTFQVADFDEDLEDDEMETPKDIDLDIDLQNFIYEKLHSIGINVTKGPNMQREIVAAVSGLADLVKNFEGCYKEVFQLNDYYTEE
ncbi:hypothetical protein TRFO_40023 [Tritrichomonas foetus]|uniref:Leucine Rich Repeat family protein n=1 Tax=Tritrichomonas foetus TaxID=1144522 RepID=A0A1J4J2Q6_9EUKA|nr:hypothetical protein TRFO_40023 [Tritrichomonas foetus]|eukprot:OHS93702.1 hypothetical protein TRFO_40023 [Tritrichomonas foetus]